MGSFGVSLVAWFVAPAVLYVLALGVGLALERITTFRVPNALLAPLGLCGAVLLGHFVYRLGAGSVVAAALLVAVALAGFAFARHELRERVSPGVPAVLAALAAYGLFMAPVVLSGGWTWTGYNFVNDTSVQFLLADHVARDGMTAPIGAPSDTYSTPSEYVRVYLSTGYPVGSHGLIAVVTRLTQIPIEAAYNPFLAALVAFATLSFSALGRRSGLLPVVAALTAFAAVAANLIYQYALQGNVKEIAMLATLAATVAFARELLSAERPVAGAACLAVCGAAMVSVYSAAAVPYAGVVAAMVLAGAFLVPRSPLRARIVPAAIVALGLAAVAAIPALTQIVRFGGAAKSVFAKPSAQADLGHLLRPLELVQAAGVWLSGDYRIAVPPERHTLSAVLIALVLLLALIGLVWAFVRREPGPLLYLAAAGITLLVISPRTSPYADAKMIALLSPGIVLLAGFGTSAIGRLWKPAAYGLGVVAVGAMLWSDAYAYHVVQLAPINRMHAMEDVARHAHHGKRLVLVTEADEFTRYFMRNVRINVATDSITPKQMQLLIPQSVSARWFDLDEYRFDYLDQFDSMITPRSPSASRPPGNYELTYQNDDYTLWTRRGEPDVREHLGAYTKDTATATPACDSVRALARRAQREGDEVLVALRTEEPEFTPVDARTAGFWPESPIFPGNVVPLTPGESRGRVSVRGGRYRVWVRGTFGRAIHVIVDGRDIGAAKGVNSPGQWHEVRELRLSRGRHSVALAKHGGNLRPGDGFIGYVGPLALQPLARQPMLRLKPSDTGRLCGRRVDWIERIRSPSSADDPG